MDDLISRSVVLEILSNEFDMAAEERSEADNEKDRAFNAGEINCARRSTRKVKELPAVDAVPVVHARWIEDGYRGIPCVCSHCGEEAHYTSTFREQFDYDWEENLVPCGYEEIREHIRSNCCPNCGARMDAEEEA